MNTNSLTLNELHRPYPKVQCPYLVDCQRVNISHPIKPDNPCPNNSLTIKELPVIQVTISNAYPDPQSPIE